MTRPFHGGRGFLDGIHNAVVRAAAAEVVVHALENLGARGPRCTQQQCIGVQDHSRRTVTALKGVMLGE